MYDLISLENQNRVNLRYQVEILDQFIIDHSEKFDRLTPSLAALNPLIQFALIISAMSRSIIEIFRVELRQ